MKKAKTQDYSWNLKQFYDSPEDPRIEKDMRNMEVAIEAFANKYDTKEKTYLGDTAKLLEALTDFEELNRKSPKPLFYFFSMADMDSRNNTASAKYALYSARLAKAYNKLTFFRLSLGTIDKTKQKDILEDEGLQHFRVMLARIFDDAKHHLSVAEENIINLKYLPAYQFWVDSNERLLNSKTVKWKGKVLPLSEALSIVQQLPKAKDRKKLSEEISKVLETVTPFSEAEINAIFTDKKIDDELRGYGKPYEDTVARYRNDPKVIESLVKTVTESFKISQRFYKLKSRLLGQKKLNYCDRAAKIGRVKRKFTFDDSVRQLFEIYDSVDAKFSQILKGYLENGQIDVYPKVGKAGGAYCHSLYSTPTLVLLNHTDDLHSFTTIAHELGHAFHTEMSRTQGPIYSEYSTALAETASTLFESLALGKVMEQLSPKEKIIVLHDKINDGISTIFRQIACFNYENEVHKAVREKGFVSTEELATMHNRHMQAYLGPIFDLRKEDGYMFVQWSHIRRFFYVYSYAYGQLVSKAMLRRYKADKNFWKNIEKFLTSGGKDSPENILKEIGIDVSKPEFWLEGLKEIEDDIDLLEKLTGKSPK